MGFLEVIEQARAALESKGRPTYRSMKFQFQLDEEHVEALKEELLGLFAIFRCSYFAKKMVTASARTLYRMKVNLSDELW